MPSIGSPVWLPRPAARRAADQARNDANGDRRAIGRATRAARWWAG